MWPGSTFASKKSAEFAGQRSRFIRKSRFNAKRMAMLRQPAIAKRSYGKSTIVKLTRTVSCSVGSATDFNSVYGLVAIAKASNDWANYASSFALFNILSITCKIYPQYQAPTAGIDKVSGFCYDLKDSAAVGSLQSITDHEQYVLVNHYAASSCKFFTLTSKAKATGAVPQSVTSDVENYGYIKGYGDDVVFPPDKSLCLITFVVTIAFSNNQ